jgi:hypothetical protein
VAEHSRNPWRTAFAVAVCAAGVSWLFTARGAEPSRDRPATAEVAAVSREELRRVRTELERLRSDLARAERRIAELELVTSQAAVPGVAVAEPDDTRRTAAASPEPSDDGQRSAAARSFDAEADDPSWNPDSEIEALVQAALPSGATLRSVVCRSTLCRVETSHPDTASQQAYASTLSMPRPGGPQPFKGVLFDSAKATVDGRELRSITYLVRSGHVFPDR